MKLRKLPSIELCRRLGIRIDETGAPTPSSLARLIRAAVARRRVAPKRQIRRYVNAQLDAAGLLSDESWHLFGEVLDRLIELEDIAEVRAYDAPMLAATEPGWVRVAPNVGVLVGTIEDPPELRSLDESSPGSGEQDADPLDCLVRRFSPQDDFTIRAALHERGAIELTLEQWCRVPEYTAHLRKRGRAVNAPLDSLWHALQDALDRTGGPVSDPSLVRAISGQPGGLFGRARGPSGRWSHPATDGVWCGALRGYSEDHWHPAIVRVEDGRPTRALHLYDHDERCWALIARGLATGDEEVIAEDGRDVTVTFPLPRQVKRAMRLVGRSTGGWKWRLPSDADRPWRLFW